MSESTDLCGKFQEVFNDTYIDKVKAVSYMINDDCNFIEWSQLTPTERMSKFWTYFKCIIDDPPEVKSLMEAIEQNFITRFEAFPEVLAIRDLYMRVLVIAILYRYLPLNAANDYAEVYISIYDRIRVKYGYGSIFTEDYVTYCLDDDNNPVDQYIKANRHLLVEDQGSFKVHRDIYNQLMIDRHLEVLMPVVEQMAATQKSILDVSAYGCANIFCDLAFKLF